MKVLARTGLASVFFLSLSSSVLGSTLVTPNQPFSTEFIAVAQIEENGTIIDQLAASSHGPSTINFGQASNLLSSNNPGAGIPNIFVTTQSNLLSSSNWQLDLTYETETNNGFIPAGIGLGNPAQAINQWVIDLGGLFSNADQGIQLNKPVEYTAATIEWFDNGVSRLSSDALNRILSSSSPTELRGQFFVGLPPGSDLGAFENGLDRAVITVQMTVVPEPFLSFRVWLFVIGVIAISSKKISDN